MFYQFYQQPSAYEQTVALYADILLLNKRAFIPNEYIADVVKTIKGEGKLPFGSNSVAGVGQFFYIEK